MKALRFILAICVVAGLAVTMAAAEEGDPPARVARLSYSRGAVSFQPGGEGDWVTAVANRPLIAGDNLWADQNSRAELHIGSTGLRLNSNTSLTFLQLDDQTVQLRLSLGSMNIRLVHLDDSESFEVATPNLAFTLLRPGEYRIDVTEDGLDTVTTVWQGQGEAVGGGQAWRVVAGQRARFTGNDTLDYDLFQLPPKDDFDYWAMDRDRREDTAESASYVSREITGYEDLDEYGHWHYVAGYGYVWAPETVPAGWAPYRYGHWVWIAPWGWTWVDDAPWGFAPFHYGRWANVNERWFWVPGPVHVRPVYAPALVAFVGGSGAQLSVPVGGPGVGWFPLGPGEVYVPMYHTSRRYVEHVNTTNTVVNVTKVTNVYNHYNGHPGEAGRVTYIHQNGGGVTTVSRDTFINARPVGRNMVRVPDREVMQTTPSNTMPVNPVRSSEVGAGTPTRNRPPMPVVTRPVVVNRVPPAPPHTFSNIESERMSEGNNGAVIPAPRNNSHPVPRPLLPGRTEPAPAIRPAIVNPPPVAPHPLVRPAPQPQPKTQQQWQDEEAKNRRWQQQRTNPPAPAATPAPHPSPARNEHPQNEHPKNDHPKNDGGGGKERQKQN